MESRAARFARPSLPVPSPLPFLLSSGVSTWRFRDQKHSHVRRKRLHCRLASYTLFEVKSPFAGDLPSYIFLERSYLQAPKNVLFSCCAALLNQINGKYRCHRVKVTFFLLCTAIIILFIVLASAVIQKTRGKRQRGPRYYPSNG